MADEEAAAADVPVLPCGCAVAGSLFPTSDGRKVLITTPPTRNRSIPIDVPAAVWCATGHWWVSITDQQYTAFKSM